MTVHIVGAGLAGLLAANMLRHRDPVVHEVQPTLPNNHSAVLRFRTPAVGDVLNIPFKKVTMIKASHPWRNPIADALAYSFKNTGTFRSDRSIVAGTTVADRWIAPPNLISRIAERLDIKFGRQFDFADLLPVGEVKAKAEPIISTIPMPALMKLLAYGGAPEDMFNYTSSINITATIANCDAYVSLMVPDPSIPVSRISITGDQLIIECAGDKTASTVESLVVEASYWLGISSFDISDVRRTPQKYAKISQIDEAARHNFLFWATDKFGIYSLGRFATWRPGLLLDDIVNDVRKIDHWIGAGRYAIARHR